VVEKYKKIWSIQLGGEKTYEKKERGGVCTVSRGGLGVGVAREGKIRV